MSPGEKSYEILPIIPETLIGIKKVVITKSFVPYAQKYRKPRVSSNFSDRITASDGMTTQRVITAVEFCTKYGICLNTLKWHVYKGRIVVFKGRRRQWLVDMENSHIPVFKHRQRTMKQLNVNVRLRETEIKSALEKDRFCVEIDGENYYFSGSKLVYEAIGRYIAVNQWSNDLSYPSKLPSGKLAKLACKLENGKKHYFSCHLDKIATALDELIGKPIGDSKITHIWMGSKGHMI